MRAVNVEELDGGSEEVGSNPVFGHKIKIHKEASSPTINHSRGLHTAISAFQLSTHSEVI